MLDEVKNLKDSGTSSNIAIKDSSIFMSYTKTDKLITALYIVTDIIEKEEPIRNKLRTLGTGILSDINLLRTSIIASIPKQVNSKVDEILSFLDIASAVGMISAMNYAILKKEFLELRQSIEEFGQGSLSGFFAEISKGHRQSLSIDHSFKGHKKEYQSTGIGVQKGSTLMKALSDKASTLSNIRADTSNRNNFDVLKQQRRNEVISIIKTTENGFTITDIKTKAKESPLQSGALVSCGEKTLQRELVSMVKDGVLDKTGSKRWSRYFLRK